MRLPFPPIIFLDLPIKTKMEIIAKEITER